MKLGLRQGAGEGKPLPLYSELGLVLQIRDSCLPMQYEILSRLGGNSSYRYVGKLLV